MIMYDSKSSRRATSGDVEGGCFVSFSSAKVEPRMERCKLIVPLAFLAVNSFYVGPPLTDKRRHSKKIMLLLFVPI